MMHRALAAATLLAYGCSHPTSAPTFDFLVGDDLRAEVIIDGDTVTATASDAERTIEVIVTDATRERLPWHDEMPDGFAMAYTGEAGSITEADLDWYHWDSWASPSEGYEGSSSWSTPDGEVQGFTLMIGGEAPAPSPWSCWGADDAWCAEGHARDEDLPQARIKCEDIGGTLHEREDSCIEGAPEPTGNCSTVYFYDTCPGSEPWVHEVCRDWGDLDYAPTPGCVP